MAHDADGILQVHFRPAGASDRHRSRAPRAHAVVEDEDRDREAATRSDRTGAELGQGARPADRREPGALAGAPRRDASVAVEGCAGPTPGRPTLPSSARL